MSLALPQPMLFDAAGHRCVGWWHAPQPGHAPADAPALPRGWIVPGPLPLTVVMVGSRGEEDLSAYDGQRQLAVALAEGGLGTLRFDWPDGGDSSAPTGQATLAELLATIDAAATQALALSGGHRLAFVGLRVGALLAAHAALARRDVEALIGLLPVAGGRAFVREQRMLGAALAVPADGGAAPADAAVALGGFVLSAAQVAELAALKWPAAAPSALRAALLLHRPGDVVAPVVGALKQLGASVGQWSHAELARALAIAHQASLAPPAIAEMVRWLQERAGAADPASAPPPGAALASVATAALAVARLASAAAPWLHLQDAGGPVRERVCRIPAPRRAAPGQGGAPLVGVLA